VAARQVAKRCRTAPGSARLPSARDLSALPLRRLLSAKGKASWRSANAAGRASRPRAIGREPVRSILIPHRCGKGGRICRGIASPLPVAPNSPCRRPEAHGPRLSLRVRARRPRAKLAEGRDYRLAKAAHRTLDALVIEIAEAHLAEKMADAGLAQLGNLLGNIFGGANQGA
jgi:hypothetical protein